MNPEEENKLLQAWQTSAPYWDKYRALITQMFAPITMGLIEEARIGVGHKVLDIGGATAIQRSPSQASWDPPDQ